MRGERDKKKIKGERVIVTRFSDLDEGFNNELVGVQVKIFKAYPLIMVPKFVIQLSTQPI